MEKICKWCSNYNKGKCTILNEKLNVDQPLIYWGILGIIGQFFDKNFKINENFINEIEKIFEESRVEWKDKEKFFGKEKIIK